MRFDYLNSNIYKSTEYAYAQNLSLILPAVCLLLVGETVRYVFDLSSTGLFAGKMVLKIWVAYAFHTTILLGVTSNNWRDHFRAGKSYETIKPFMWRSFAFFGISLGIILFVFILSGGVAAMLRNDGPNIFGVVFLGSLIIIGLPIYGLLFAVFGTSLPAAVSGDNASFSAAFKRAKGLYWFTYGRLLVGPALFITGLVALSIGLQIIGFPVSVFSENGQFDPVGVGVSFLLYAFQLFSIGLTVTVLCKAYLLGESDSERPT